MSLISLHCTGSHTITGTMWLGLSTCGMPARVETAHAAHAILMALALVRRLAFRCVTAAQAPAATAGGSAVVKMKPRRKLRTKSHSAVGAVI